MRFSRAGGGSLVLSDEVVATLSRYRQHGASDPEAGGILLGRILASGEVVLVDGVTEPTSADRRSRTRFVRAREPTQTLIREAWSASGGTQIYLGEWHTHPENVPHPSYEDLRSWKRLTRTAQYEQEMLFFLIAGLVVTRAWEMRRGGEAIMASVEGTDCGRRLGDELSERSATTGGLTPDGYNTRGWIP